MQGAGIRRWAVAAGALATVGLGFAAGPLAAKDITIKMAVPDWPPTRIMQDLANERYKAPSGNNVKLEEDFIPWPNYYERLAASLTSGEKKYQMAVSDSQWLGAFVEGGYYMKINKFIDADPKLQAIFKDLHPNLVAAYSTYPYKSDNYYGFPQMPDVLIVYYRKDVFCDPGEQAAYKAKYGQKLPCEPEEMDDVDWDQVKNFGEFFRRAKGDQLAGKTIDDDFYGIAYQSGKGYDFSSMEINTFIWQHGANIWDETKAPKGQAEGVVNSPEAVKALEHYLSLQEYMPPVVKTGTMDIFKVDELFREGKVGWIVQWIGFAESTITPSTSKVADKVAFAQQPGTRDSDGKLIRWSNIGGQPFVLTTWNSDEVTKESIDFCKWWLSPEIQTEFAKRGGQSGLKSVYSKPDYLTFRPWNRTWAASLDWQKDVWHVPEFFELLVEQQEQFDMAITGQLSAKQALDNIAAFQQNLLSESGRIE
jgi:multiple sugar transport system substrate-binding protein